MGVTILQWLKDASRGSKSRKNKKPERSRHQFEQLESRTLLSISNLDDPSSVATGGQLAAQEALQPLSAEITTAQPAASLDIVAPAAPRQMENLGRGVVAVRTSSGAFVNWRLLALDPSGIGFNVYRSANGGAALKLNGSPLTGGTNYTDTSANMSVNNDYFVRPVVSGVEQAASAPYTLKANTTVEPAIVVPLRTPDSGYYTKFVWVGDLDGNGEYDYVIDRLAPTDPNNGNIGLGPQKIEAYKSDGTFLWTVDFGPNSLNTYNITPGSSSIDTGHNDGVAVYDLDGDGKAEVVIKSANGVTLGDGTVVTNSNDNVQFISVLDGMTGAERARIQIPTDYLSVGQLAFRTGIAYFNGSTPSIVGVLENRNADKSFNYMVNAWDFNGSSLSLRWKWLRGNQNCPSGHQFRIADVDGNGTDEILDNGFALNSDGTLRYTLGPAGIVHGDRFHIGKFDPNRPGLQGYGIQQDNPNGILEYYFDASTGEILWLHTTTPPGGDVGRGVVGDIDPRYPGYETWAFGGVYNGPTNTQITTGNSPYPCQTFWWDGDLLTDNLNDGKFEKWNYTSQTVSRLLTLWQYENSTDSGNNPMFMGDIFGDWRTEVINLSNDYSKLVIFTSDIPTSYRIYTLAQDPAYRAQMTLKGYMEMSLPDFYLGDGMSTPPAPIISYVSNDPGNAAPTVATSAAASPNPVAGFTTNLSVLGADDGSEANLIYNWSALGPEPVSFSANGVNAAKNSVATFTKAGSYTFTALISDTAGRSTLSSVIVTVNQTQSGITLSPLNPTVIATGTQQFTAVAYDQFSDPLSPQPPMTWSVISGGGTINSSGLYTAPSAAGSATVQVTGGGFTKTTSVTINVGAPTVAQPASASPSPATGTTTNLSVLGASTAGEEKLTYTWASTGSPPASVTFTLNGSNTAKNTVAIFTKVGAYSFQVTIVDQIGQSVTSSVNVTVNQTLTTITLSPSTVNVNLGGTQQFTASAKDQFGSSMSTQPSFTWSVVSGGGTINSSGLYTAPGTAGLATVQAAGGGKTGTAAVYVGNIFINDIDVGNVGLPGSTTYSNGIYTVTGSNATDAGDGFHFASMNISGNRTLIVRVDSQSSNTGYSGLMFRKSTANDSAYASVSATDDSANHIFFRYRTSDGGSSGYSVKYQDAPVWLKLTRSGNNFTGYYSTDNVYWTQVGSSTINSMPTSALGGLAVNSDGSTLLSTTQFSNVSVVTSANTVPTVYTAASASPNPVTGATTNLSVLGADDGGETNLTYTWSTTGTPPAPVIFSANGTNAAKNSTAIFTKAGVYSFLVTIRDSAGLTATSSRSVTVNQILTSVLVSPNPTTVFIGQTRQFTATGYDQFGNSLTSQPSFTWTAAPGSINSTGLYTAPMSTTTATVTASSSGKNGTATANITLPATIAARTIFYNNSKFDLAGDDNAISTDKAALLPSQTATFNNYTSYDKGINGIIVDIQNLANPGAISAADFQFKVGNDNNPAAWATAPAPASVTVNTGGGTGGSDRVTILWTDNAIENQWLQVQVLATANTGLATADVFYFGNAVGESGDNSANAVVDLQDETNAWNNKSGFSAAEITNNYDYNRDGRVTVADVLVARHNSGPTPLQLITVPSGGPMAAQDALQPLALLVENAPTETVSTQIISAAITAVPTSSGRVGSAIKAAKPQAADEALAYSTYIFSTPIDKLSGPLASTIQSIMTEGIGTLSPRRNDAAPARLATGQNRLHDAVFARFVARRSLIEDNTPDNSAASSEIDTLLHDRLAAKAGKQLVTAIDAIFATRHKK